MVDGSRTYHASQAVALAELLLLKFAKERYGTTVPRVVKVLEPDGPSTDGGRKARQPLVLMPERGPENRGVMCGWIDGAKQMGELRSYAVINQAFQARHNEALDLSRGEYDRFLQAVQEFLKAQSLQVHFSNAPTARAPTMPPASVPPPGSSAVDSTWMTPVLVGTSFLLGFVLCLVLVKAGVL
jgi:hypothetical protein